MGCRGVTLNGAAQIIDVFIQTLLLVCTGGLAREICSVEISLRRQSADSCGEVTQCLSRLHLVNARLFDLAFHVYKLALLSNGDLNIRLRKDSHHITGFENQVLFWVALDRLCQIEGQEMGGEVLGLE